MYRHPDPFFLKEEFAPSDNPAMVKRRHLVHNLLAPHTRLMQFFSSHFNATRLSSPDTQRVFLRMLDLTLEAMRKSASHPMARELNLSIILFSLRVLKTSTSISNLTQWRLKDKILSAGLSWFKHSPKWSFGSNVLQMKTEIRLIFDVMAAMKSVGYIAAHPVGSFKGLAQKEQLLHLLLESEQARMNVWVHPLGNTPAKADQASLLPLVRTAWAESPSLAIELVSRYSFPNVNSEVRWLLLNFPEKAIDEPEALPILLGGELPADARAQLKVRPSQPVDVGIQACEPY